MKSVRWSMALVLVACVVAVAGRSGLAQPGPAFADADDPALVARGAAIYGAQCASCHGAHLEGQPNWQVVGANGRVPAPPHDATGHTWEHPDDQIFRLTKFGMADVAPKGYVSDMPAFDGRLADADILAAIAFIKNRWPVGVRVSQAMLNPGFAGLPPDADKVEWRFPPTCTAVASRTAPAP